MYNIGLSAYGLKINEELFAAYKSAGISEMEISAPAHEHSFLNWKGIWEWGNRHNVGLWSYHLPYDPFDKLDISRKDLAEYSVAYLKELMKPACDVGIDKLVIHPSGEPINDDERSERMLCAKESLAMLAETAEKCGAKLAVEDLPRTCLGRNSEEIKELVSVHDNLYVCFDTNHLLYENQMDFIRSVGNKIITVHISDYDFVDEKHWLPGEGKIDWSKVIETFRQENYNGVWMYEVRLLSSVGFTRTRNLTCSDILRNARELFAGEKISLVPHL